MHTQQAILLAIRSTAESIKGVIQPTLLNETPKVGHNTCDISIPALDLPLPIASDFDAILKTLGLSERGYCEVYRKIQTWVHNLQTAHSLYFQRSCHSLASLPHFQSRRSLDIAIEQLRLTYQQKYASCLPLIKQILSVPPRRNSKNAKTPFNDVSTLQNSFLRCSPHHITRNIRHFWNRTSNKMHIPPCRIVSFWLKKHG